MKKTICFSAVILALIALFGSPFVPKASAQEGAKSKLALELPYEVEGDLSTMGRTSFDAYHVVLRITKLAEGRIGGTITVDNKTEPFDSVLGENRFVVANMIFEVKEDGRIQGSRRAGRLIANGYLEKRK